jgi:gluconolactonase
MEAIAWGYGLPEAPRADAAGNLWFSDVLGGGVHRRTPDGTTIYHSNYSEGHVLAHDLDADGRAVHRRIFATLPRGNPDGLAVDERGRVWVAMGPGGGIARFTPGGALDTIVAVPASFVAILALGGPDGRDLYVTTMDDAEHPERGGTVFRSRADAPGLRIPLARV